MGKEKLIPRSPHVEDILDWEWVNTEFNSDIAPQSQKMILSDAPFMSLGLYYCDVVKCLMKEAPLSLAPHQTPINKARCRRDKNSVSSPPLEPCFDVPNNSPNHLLNSLLLCLEKLAKKSSNQTTHLFSCQNSL